MYEQVHPAVGAVERRRRRGRAALRAGVLPGRVERVAEGKDHQGLPGRRRRPHTRVKVGIRGGMQGCSKK